MTDITWHINMQNYLTDQRAQDFVDAVKKSETIEAKDESMLSEYAMLLATTEGLEFDDALARQPLREFKAIIASWQAMPVADVWAYRKRLAYILMNTWREAWSEGQNLFNPDPVILPTAALTTEQKAEAETPGSPLASPAGSSRSK